MSISAVTDIATLQVLFWGADAGVPLAGAGQSRAAGIADGDATIINAAKPRYTKVVGFSFVAMSAGEKDVVDAADLAVSQAADLADLIETLDGNPTEVYPGINAQVTLDWSNLDHEIELAGNITNDAILLANLPASGMARRITVKVLQGGIGGFLIDATAWPTSGSTAVDWGTKGAPTFGEAAGKFRLVVLYCDGTIVTGHYDTNVFG